MNTTRKMIITWNDYGIYLKDLIMKIESEGKRYTGVHGLPRGGLPIAVAVSHYFDIPIIKHISFNTNNLLIVDDICDSGETLKTLLTGEFGNNHPDVATMFLRTDSKYQPLYWCKQVNHSYWVDFPYEYPDRPDTISQVTNS